MFKVQANMDRSHRDRIAFLRVCSGRFERGMVVTHEPTGKPFATKYAHQVFGQDRETIEEAFPGDVVGLVNATDVRVGDTLVRRRAGDVSPHPELRARSTSRSPGCATPAGSSSSAGASPSSTRRAWCRCCATPTSAIRRPVLAAVGPMQFEVAVHRLENEFGAPVELSPTAYHVARRTDAASAAALRAMRGVDVLARADGTLLALFESRYWLDRLLAEQPELTLEPMVAGERI